MAQGSGGYGGPDFAGIENNLRNIAVQFSSILQIQMQLRASVDAWVSLERELVLAQAAAEGTKRQFAEMERSARTFALASTFSAGQVANAFYNLASAGLNVNQTLAASSGVLLLAQATLVDIGQASDTAASAMAQFGLDAAETYRISNLFVASTNASLSTVPKLSFALRQVGPMARDAGLSIEDVVTSLDKLFDVGLRGEQAGTALRNAIARLQDPSGEASLALRAYGVELTNAQGQARQWLDIMRDLARVNPSQASLTQIFGLEAATGASALLQSLRKELDSGSTAWDRHRKEISNTDAAYRQAALQMATFGGQLQVASNHFNEFRIQIGQALAPVITGLLSQLNGAVDGFNEMSQSQKISTISTVLWGVEALVAAKSFGVLVGGAGNAAKSITQFQQAAARFSDAWYNAPAGRAGLGQVMSTGAVAGQRLVGVLGSIAGTAVALGGLVAVMYALKQGIDAANDAAEQAAIKQIAQGTFERYAQNNRGRLQQRGVSADNLIDQTNTAAAFNDQANNLRKQFQIQDDGTGAFQLIRAQQVTIDQGRQDIRTLAEKQRALTQDFRQYGEQRQQLGSAISDAYSHSFFGLGSTRGVEENLVASANDAGQMARRILSEAGRVQQAGVGGARQALVTYYNARIKDAKETEGLTASARAEIVIRATAIRDNVIRADQAGVETIYGAFNKAASGASEKLAKEGATRSIQSLTMSDYTNNIRDFGANFAKGVKENLVLTEEQLNNAVADIKNQEASTRATVDRLVRELPSMDNLFSKELVAFILRNANFTPAQRQAFENALSTKEGQRILGEITTRARTEHLELGAAAQLFGNSLALFRNDVKVKINAAVDKGLGTPMIDVFQLEKKFNENNLAFQRQALRSAELAQNNPQALAIMKDITKGSNQAAMDTAVDDLVRSFNSSNDAQNREKLDRLLRGPSGQGNRETIEGIITRYIQGGSDSKSKAGAQLQAFLTKQGVFDATTQGDVPAALRTAAKGLEAQQLGNQNALREYTNRINTTVTPEETIRKELNALPSRSQLDLQGDQLEAQARATLGEYFNMPLEAITRAMQNTQLQYREKIAEFRDKYRTMFTDTLAKGVDGAQGNAETQDAFSGRLIEQLVSTGSTTFNGNTYSEVDKLLSAITDQFSAVTANAPEHEARVQKAREILASLARNIGLTVDQLGAEMQVNRLKLMDTRTKIQDFMRNFDAQQLMDDLTRAIRQDALTGQQSVTLSLAVNAEVGRVRLDGAQAVSKMRESFAEYFRNANIPVVFNPQTQQFEAAGDKISTDPAVVAGKLFDTASTKFAQAVAAFANAGGHTGPGDNVSGSLRTPSIGRVTGRFGESRPGHMHAGIDYAVPVGTNIAATGAGIVRAAGQRGAYGNAVEIDHGNGITSLYAHLSRVMVQAGQRITAEQLIGLSGSTGRSTGPHLHYEVRRNGKAVDPRDSYAYHGTRQPASNDDNRDTSDIVVTAPRVNDAQARAQKAAEDARIAAFNKMLADEAKYWQEVESFTKRPENAIIALAAAAEQADKKFSDFGGRLLDSEKYFVNLDKNFAELREKMFVGMAGQSRNANAFIPEIEGAKRAQQLATIEGERIDALRQVRSLYAQQAIDANSLKDIEAQINGYYDKRKTLAGRGIEDRRSTLRERAEILRVQSDSNLTQGSGDLIRGLRAEVLQFAAELPTVFETASQLAVQALQGPGQLMSDLLITGGKNARSLVAQMASSMASLIATMMTNFAVMQLISVLPGGKALLSAMDAASKVSSGITAAVGIGNMVANNVRASQSVTPPPIDTGVKYAEGGIHYSPASRMELAMGGVRAPFNGSRAVFGEGQHPEAFIPMVDRRTIPVTFDQQGNAYVPLPSGQRIPVTVNNYGAAYNDNHEERYFANGGVGGGDNVIPFTPQRARIADQMVSGREQEAVAPMRGSTGGVQQQPSSITQITELGGIHIHMSGNTSRDDANDIAAEIMKQVTAALDARDADNFRRTAKRQQSVQAGYYGGSN